MPNLTRRREPAGMTGLSIVSGVYMGWSQQLLERLREQNIDDVQVVVGGVIPEADIPVLQELGVAAVFPGGTPFAEVIATIRSLVQ